MRSGLKINSLPVVPATQMWWLFLPDPRGPVYTTAAGIGPGGVSVSLSDAISFLRE